MDVAITHCYRFNFFLLSTIGLCLHSATIVSRILRIIYIIILLSGTIIQLVIVINVKHPAKQLLHHLSFVMVSGGCTWKYITFLFIREDLIKVMDRVKRDWNSILNTEEFQVFKRYGYSGRQYTKYFALMIYQTTFILIISQYSFIFFDFVQPLKEPREPFYLVKPEAFEFLLKYPQLCLLFTSIAVFFCAATIVGTETMFIMWLQHAASLYEISTFRMKLAFSDSCLRMQIFRRKVSQNDMLVVAVSMHRNATQFTECLIKTFLMPYFVLLIFGVLSLSINLYRFAQACPYEIGELLSSTSFIVSELGYMYYLNAVAQQVADICNNIFREVYHTKWYETSVTMQKKLLLISLRTTKPFIPGIRGIYVASLEGFAAVCKLSLSYFMAIYSVQN